jgi:TolA-binding protein
MKMLPALLLAGLTTLFSISSTLHAQSPAAQKEFENSYALFSSADYKSAATAYEEIIKGYPTDILVQPATIQLAICQFYLGEFDKSLGNLDKSRTGPPLNAEQSTLLDNLRPQILGAKAMSLPPADSARKGIFEQAIKSYSDFITKYPQSEDLENAYYGRALCEYQIGDYDKTITDLQTAITKFPASTTIQGSKNLLAIAFATQGGEELSKPSGDKAKGMGLFKQAEDILRGIIADKKDLALVNDANFQLGEILFMHGANSSEEEKQAIYTQAAAAYMSVLPKEDVVAMQQEKIKSFGPLKVAALRNRNLALRDKLNKENERELKKLAEISAKPDQTAQALLKLGEIFFNAGKYNESRVVISHVTPFLTEQEEKMRGLYYKTMGYAIQGNAEAAVKDYDQFQGSFKGKPIAENLPFLLGNMFLAQGKSQESIRYFDESLQFYPQGRLSGLSVAQKAQAQVGLKQYDEALRTFQASLQKNPTPDIAVVAQSGIANIYRDTARWPEAITAYKLVIEKHADSPQAVDAAYYVAAATQQKGDHAGAIPLLEAFIKAHPDNQLVPLATFALGSSQIAAGKKKEGVDTLNLLAEKYPDSPASPVSYFGRAQVYASEQKPEEINKLMRTFIEKYPQNENIYYAYNSIAQNAVSAGKADEAIQTWTEFTEKYPDHPKTPSALITLSGLQRNMAERLATNFSSLNEDDRLKWQAAMDASNATIEGLLAKYPQSPDLAPALQSLLTNQRLLIRSERKTDANVETYFQELADKASDPSARSKILFTVAGLISEKDKPRGLAKMSEAYDAKVLYSPKDIDIFGLALLEAGKTDEAGAVFDKLAADYPLPAGVAPTAAAPLVQEAQATATFGKGRIAQVRGQTAEAGKLFQELKSTYPWSPKVLEADYGIAQSLRSQRKGDEAMQLLGGIIRAQNATAELRANSFLLYGHIMKDKMTAETDAKKKEANRGAAIDFFMKIPQFYSGVPAAAAEGLWEGGQLLEQQVEASTDPKFKTAQLKRAKSSYEQLVKDFPNDKFAAQAKQRLQALPAQ